MTAECDALGASVAKVVMARRINANAMHRLRLLAREGGHGAPMNPAIHAQQRTRSGVCTDELAVVPWPRKPRAQPIPATSGARARERWCLTSSSGRAMYLRWRNSIDPGELPRSMASMGICGQTSRILDLFSSHPPIEEHIAAPQNQN